MSGKAQRRACFNCRSKKKGCDRSTGNLRCARCEELNLAECEVDPPTSMDSQFKEPRFKPSQPAPSTPQRHTRSSHLMVPEVELTPTGKATAIKATPKIGSVNLQPKETGMVLTHRRACDPCRKVKKRCNKVEQDETCIPCQNSNKKCIYTFFEQRTITPADSKFKSDPEDESSKKTVTAPETPKSPSHKSASMPELRQFFFPQNQINHKSRRPRSTVVEALGGDEAQKRPPRKRSREEDTCNRCRLIKRSCFAEPGKDRCDGCEKYNRMCSLTSKLKEKNKWLASQGLLNDYVEWNPDVIKIEGSEKENDTKGKRMLGEVIANSTLSTTFDKNKAFNQLGLLEPFRPFTEKIPSNSSSIDVIQADQLPLHDETTKESDIHSSSDNPYKSTNTTSKPEQTNRNRSSIILPPKGALLVIVKEFFKNEYQIGLTFIHQKSFISWIESPVFESEIQNYATTREITDTYKEPCVLLALLSISARFDPFLISLYGGFDLTKPDNYTPKLNHTAEIIPEFFTPSNASAYFNYHIKKSFVNLVDSLGTPTLPKIQVLVLLAYIEWCDGKSEKSTYYMVLAHRAGSSVGLFDFNSEFYEDEESLDDQRNNILKESKKRTAWAMFIMDRFINCGSQSKSRVPCFLKGLKNLKNLPLPLPEDDFNSGISRSDWATGSKYERFYSTLSSMDFSILAISFYAEISLFIRSLRYRAENFENRVKKFSLLIARLKNLRVNLPDHLRLRPETTKTHISKDNYTFIFFHLLFLHCGIMLYREFFYYNHSIFPDPESETESKKVLAIYLSQIRNELELSTTIMETHSKLNPRFFTNPFISYQIFTNSVTSALLGSIYNDVVCSTLSATCSDLLMILNRKDQEVANKWSIILYQIQTRLDELYGSESQVPAENRNWRNVIPDWNELFLQEHIS